VSYYIATTVARPFDSVVSEVVALLKVQGFGVLTDIDLRAELR